jgi:hypothetical protein
VRTHSERAIRQFHQQPIMAASHPFAGLRESQLSKAQREQALVAPPGPWGTLIWSPGHPHIQRSSNAQRNSSGELA